MEIETKRYQVIETTEIELIEDVWERCKAHDWDKGKIWNTQIAPHKEGTLVKCVMRLMPNHQIISVEEVTDKMIEGVFYDSQEMCECGHDTKDHSYDPQRQEDNLYCDKCDCEEFVKGGNSE